MNTEFSFFRRCAEPKKLGAWDCCIAVADHLVEAGREDLFSGFRGKYATEIGFKRLLTKGGWAHLEDAAEALATSAGLAEIDPEKARAHDLGIISFAQPGGMVTPIPAFYLDGFWNAFGDGFGISVIEARRAWRTR